MDLPGENRIHPPAMKIKLSCADFTFPLLKHEQSLDLIAMLGFKAVDIGLFERRSHLWPSREFVHVSRSAQLLRRKLSDRGLIAADVYLQTAPDFVPYAANHPDARRRRKARDWFQRTLEYAAACGAHHVSALPGARFDGETNADSFQRCCHEMSWRVESAAKVKIPFGIEAHVGSIVPRPADTMKLIRNVPGLTLTFDATHFAYAGYNGSQYEPLLSHASHVHCRGGRRRRLQCSFVDNQIDYKRMVKSLSRSSYKGYVCIEYVWIDWEHCNETDNLSETILFRDFLRNL
jgi:sugar phosphate isomerase/epimerase